MVVILLFLLFDDFFLFLRSCKPLEEDILRFKDAACLLLLRARSR